MSFGTASVEVVADTKNFRSDLNRRLGNVALRPVKVSFETSASVRALKTVLGRITAEIKIKADTRTLIRQINEELRSARPAPLSVKVTLDMSGVRNDLNDLGRGVRPITVPVTAQTGTALRNITRAFGASGSAAGSAWAQGFQLAAAALSSTLTAAVGFERQMSEVQAVSGAAADEFRALTAEARLMGATTKFTATQAAEGLTNLVRNGLSATQAVEALGPVLDLASAGALDLGKSADIATVVMNGMGLAAADMGRVSDALAKGAAASATNVEMMGSAFKRTAGAANAAGLTVEETAGAIGVLANAGFRGSAAGTGLNKILGSLANDTSKATKIFEGYGIAVKDADGTMRPFTDILIDAKRAGLDYNDAISAFGLNHGPKFAAAAGQSEEKIRQTGDAMKSAGGAAAVMAKIMADNAQGSIDSFKSAVESLQLSIGDAGLLSAFRSVTDYGTLFTRSLDKVVGSMSGADTAATVTATAMGGQMVPATLAASTAMEMMATQGVSQEEALRRVSETMGLSAQDSETLGTAFTKLSDDSARMESRITGVFDVFRTLRDTLSDAGVFTAVSAAFSTLRDRAGTLMTTMSSVGVFSSLQSALSGISKVIVGLLPAVGAFYESLRPLVTVVFAAMAAALQGASAALGAFGDWLQSNRPAVEFFGAVISGVVASLVAYSVAMRVAAIATKAWAAAQALLNAAMALNPIGAVIIAVVALVAGFIYLWNNVEGFRNFFIGVWDGIKSAWNAASAFVGKIVSGVVGFFSDMPGSISSAIDAVAGFFKDLPEKIGGFLVGLPGMLYDLMVGALGLAAEGVGTALGYVVLAFITLPGLIFDALSMLGEIIGSAFVVAFDWVIGTLPGLILSVTVFFIQLPEKVAVALIGLGSLIWGAFMTAFNWVKNNLPGAIASVTVFFYQLPDKVGASLISLGAKFWSAMSKGFSWVKGKIPGAIDSIVSFFRQLPAKIGSALQGFGSNIWSGLKGVINDGIGILNRGINAFNKVPGPNIPTIPRLANGGIVTREQLAVIGEAGPEVVIPLSRPGRAAQLAEQSGLINLLVKQGALGPNTTTQTHNWNIRSNTRDPQVMAQSMYRKMVIASGV